MKNQRARNHGFDVLRLLLAIIVTLSHASELLYGNRLHEPLGRLTHENLTLGMLAVDGFFLLSGYLITQSWLRSPSVPVFLGKRVRRIVPGYVAAYVSTTVVVGLLAPGVPRFFHELVRYPGAYLHLLCMSTPLSPGVLPGMPQPRINASLWSISYEFRCYLLIAILGVMGVLSRRWVVLGITLALLPVAAIYSLQEHLSWHSLLLVTGEPTVNFRFVPVYLIGCCFYLFREEIQFRPALAVLAAVVLGVTIFRLPDHFEPAFGLCGGYLLFYLARSRWFTRMYFPLPDLSYGVYLYAWPVESLWIFWRHSSPFITFLVSTAISLLLAFLSWKFVEAPNMAKAKPARPTEEKEAPALLIPGAQSPEPA